HGNLHPMYSGASASYGGEGAALKWSTRRRSFGSPKDKKTARDIARRQKLLDRQQPARTSAAATAAISAGGTEPAPFLSASESEQRFVISVKNMTWIFKHVRFAYRVQSRWFGLGFKKKTVADEGHLDMQVGRDLTWRERSRMEKDEMKMLRLRSQ